MLSLLASLYLGITMSCSGVECANGMSMSITFTINIVSVMTVNIDKELVNPDVPDVYVLNITNFMAHSPIREENGTRKTSYVIVDNPKRTEIPMLIANGLENEITWPKEMIAMKYEDKVAQDILALVKKAKPHQGSAALAKVHRVLKKARKET